MNDKVIVKFQMVNRRKIVDIEIPLDITADELIFGLNSAYSLGISDEALPMTYIVCEHPIVLIKGKETLRSLGVCEGATLRYTL